MNNPWLDLPAGPPYVAPADAELLHAFNRSEPQLHRFDLSLFPEPFFGDPAALVVVLNLNPGWSESDAVAHADPEFAEQTRRSLAHQLRPYPFLHLQPTCSTPGGEWWRSRTRALCDHVGFEAVARGIACVEYMPYHSRSFSAKSPSVPSQQYGFHLVRKAMRRGAEIVLMRARRLWAEAVPELARYPRLHVAVNPRAPYLSRKNLEESYDAIALRLTANSRKHHPADAQR